MVTKSNDPTEVLLTKAVLKLSERVMGLVLGILTGLTIFIATNWLLIKGGEHVGPHLGLLGQFFIGYSVTFRGSLIGMAYGFVTGYIAGWVIAWIYGQVVALKSRKGNLRTR